MNYGNEQQARAGLEKAIECSGLGNLVARQPEISREMGRIVESLALLEKCGELFEKRLQPVIAQREDGQTATGKAVAQPSTAHGVALANFADRITGFASRLRSLERRIEL